MCYFVTYSSYFLDRKLSAIFKLCSVYFGTDIFNSMWSIAGLSITPLRLRSLSAAAVGSLLDISSLLSQVCSSQNCCRPRRQAAFALWQESSKFPLFRRCPIQIVPFALVQTMNLIPLRTYYCTLFHLCVWCLVRYPGRSWPSESHRWSSIERVVYLLWQSRTTQGLQVNCCAWNSWFWRNPLATGTESASCWSERTLAFEEADEQFLSSRVCKT